MHLAAAFELAAHRYPEAEALVDGACRLTYRDWDCQANSAAWGLTGLGMRSGQRIAICARNSASAAIAYFAAHKAGLTAVLLSTRWKSAELAHAIDDADVRLIMHDETTFEEVRKAIATCGRQVMRVCLDEKAFTGESIAWEDLMRNPREHSPDIERDDVGISTVLYTSGITGRPKGVPRTHRSDYYASLALVVQHRWSPFERTLAVMPVYHTMGLHCLISMVILNGLCVFTPNSDASACIDCIKKEMLTALYLVPTVFYDLVGQARDEAERLQSVKKLAFAGSPMSLALIQRCRNTFRPEVFVDHYGCTEMHAISINPDLSKKPDSCGRPALHSRIRVVVADANRRVLPAEEVPVGEIGEIIVDANSPQAFAGYLNRPDADYQALRNGWYFTGDLGCLDGEGDLFLKGRLDDMIISGGENIYPQEVEAVLLSHPQVIDAAVVGLPDERWGEKVVAFIVPGAFKVGGGELEEFCLASFELPRFKRPRQFVFVDEIPKSSTGKILRSKLRRDYLK